MKKNSILFVTMCCLLSTIIFLASCQKDPVDDIAPHQSTNQNYTNKNLSLETIDLPFIDPTDIPGTIRRIQKWVARMPKDAACELCSAWSETQDDNGWLEDLPDCPCELNMEDFPPQFFPPDTIAPDDPYHPGAAYCMRSRAKSGAPGQQCCYDENGNLITGGAGAGTPDKCAPVIDTLTYDPPWVGPISIPDYRNVICHFNKDVIPYFICKYAGRLNCYLENRPPNNDENCDENIQPPPLPDATIGCDCDLVW